MVPTGGGAIVKEKTSGANVTIDVTDIIYRINERDEIVYANDAWDRFALENSGHEITLVRVLNRTIWDFIADVTTRELYRLIVKKARSGGTVRFTFRCDSPTLRRHLEMEVFSPAPETCEFRTRTLYEEPREPVLIYDPTTAHAEPMLKACGWCKKILFGESWLEIETAVERLGLFQHLRPPSITHGICPPCIEMVQIALSATKSQDPRRSMDDR